MGHSEVVVLAPRDASCPYLRRESQSGTPGSHTNTLGGHTKRPLRGLNLAATLEAATGPAFRDAPGTGRSWRPSQTGHRRVRHGRAARLDPCYTLVLAASAAPAAFAASRTAPATAPATLSLKTLGMM